MDEKEIFLIYISSHNKCLSIVQVTDMILNVLYNYGALNVWFKLLSSVLFYYLSYVSNVAMMSLQFKELGGKYMPVFLYLLQTLHHTTSWCYSVTAHGLYSRRWLAPTMLWSVHHSTSLTSSSSTMYSRTSTSHSRFMAW